MEERVLIAYASRLGSTRRVAESIGNILKDAEIDVDVKNVNDVDDISSYTSVIIGSAAKSGKLLTEARKFAVKFKNDIKKLKTAYFTVCLTEPYDDVKSFMNAEYSLEPLKEIKEPVCLGLFAGKPDIKSLRWFLRHILRKAKTEEAEVGNWDDIESWADELKYKLLH